MRKLLLFTTLIMLCLTGITQKKKTTSTPTDRFAGLDTVFERVLKTFNAAGFAVAVVEKNNIVYARGFGYRDMDKKLPVTPNTLFAIGSCTKAFTASILGLLQKEGKLELDKPVTNYLPALKFYNDDMNRMVTLRDMMSHRTGLPRHDYSWYLFKSKSRDSLMKRIQYQEPSFGIRERWQYNNFMYLLQGIVAEKITGTSWENNISQRIFQPLGMTRSNFSIQAMEQSDDAALGYGVKKDSIIKKLDYYHIDAMGPAGSINSSVNEMSKWVITWINGGKYNDKVLLPPAYVTDAMSAQMVAAPALPGKEKPDIHFSAYGFGWGLGSYRSHYRVEHGGNIDGFSASTCFFPTDSIGIIVLSNQNGSSVPAVVRNLLADRLLNLPYIDWTTDISNTNKKAIAAAKEAEKTAVSNKQLNTRASHALKDYAGRYSHPGYGTFDVEFKHDSLFVNVDKDVTWLRHYHYDVFEPFNVDKEEGIDTTAKSPLRFQFHMSEAGDINALTLKMEPTLSPMKFTRTNKPQSISAVELKKYTGDYLLAGATVTVSLKNENTLFVLVPGQPEYEMVALGADKFALKIAEGFFVQFSVNEKQESTALTFIQPNGNFTAKRKQ